MHLILWYIVFVCHQNYVCEDSIGSVYAGGYSGLQDLHVWSNQDAHQLLINGPGTMWSKYKCPVLPTDTTEDVTLIYPYYEDEYSKKITTLKNKNVGDISDVLVKQLNNLGPPFHNWPLVMPTKCFTENKVPRMWRQSMINAILKPYKPISLLCHMYERLILK